MLHKNEITQQGQKHYLQSPTIIVLSLAVSFRAPLMTIVSRTGERMNLMNNIISSRTPSGLLYGLDNMVKQEHYRLNEAWLYDEFPNIPLSEWQ